jgi:hypothetical protein
LYTRSKIEGILGTFASHLDAQQYIAAAVVFSIRVNNYVLMDLIDWYNINDIFEQAVG